VSHGRRKGAHARPNRKTQGRHEEDETEEETPAPPGPHPLAFGISRQSASPLEPFCEWCED